LANGVRKTESCRFEKVVRFALVKLAGCILASQNRNGFWLALREKTKVVGWQSCRASRFGALRVKLKGFWKVAAERKLES